MKRFLSISLMMAVMATVSMAQSTEKGKAATTKSTASKPNEKAMMEAWMASMNPGPNHEMLAKSVGEWSEEVTWWMSAGAPPQMSKATCSNTMILGGRYLQSTSKGDMNGMPFEGTGTTGYDNVLKKYVSTWIDNMGTGIMYMEGTYNDASKTVTFTGKFADPMTGKMSPMRQTLKFIDEKTQIMEMFSMENGKEFKSMEIKFSKM